MSTKERFVEYLKIKGIGQTAFEESAGLSRGANTPRNNNDAKIHRKSIIQSFWESFFSCEQKIYLPLLLQRVTFA